MGVSILKSNEVWYVDFGESNHMKNHEEWFSNQENSEESGYVETDNDTILPIEHLETSYELGSYICEKERLKTQNVEK